MSCNFSIQHYQEILETALQNGYYFIDYREVSSLSPGQRACILRHDVDYVPEWTYLFAEIERDLGIRATYFFQICAQTYNLRETENYHLVHQLQSMGHRLGLHMDLGWKNDGQWEEIPSLCHRDKQLFENITGIKPCEIISFHNPHRFVEKILNQKIPKIRHTYEKGFFSDIKYLSDSQGWYEGCMCKIFASGKYPVIQLLTHSHIWPEKTTGDFISDMAQMIKYCTDELTEYLIRFHPVCKKNELRLRQEVLQRRSFLAERS